MDKSSENTNKETTELNNTIERNRPNRHIQNFASTVEEYTYFSSTHCKFCKITLVHKTGHKNFKQIKASQVQTPKGKS